MNEHDVEKYIKKKSQDIPVPPSLSPDVMEEKLSDVTQKRQRPFRIRGSVVAAAACLLLLVAGGVTARQYFGMKNMDPGVVDKQLSIADNEANNTVVAPSADLLGYEKAYEAIEEYFNTVHGEYASYDHEEDMATAEESTGAAAPGQDANSSANEGVQKVADYSDTDTQVDGVMEGDIVKTDGKYIYTIQENSTGSKVKIYSVDGKEVEQVTNIELEDCSTKEMYVEKDRLILINSLWNTDEREELRGIKYFLSSKTEIIIYDTGNMQSIKRVRTQTQSGTYSTSRVTDGYLYTFTDYSVNGDQIKKEQPDTYIPQINDKCMESDDVRCISDDKDNRYMVMTSLPVDGSQDFTDSLCALGGSEVYYVSNDNIYSAKVLSTWMDDNLDEHYTDISKYSYHKGTFEFVAKRRVRGLIQNSYYLHEYEGNLCYVYTRYKSNGTTTNGIVTLDDKLKKLGELDNLGVRERIYSSYYIDNIAYFVTYRETDPVFAVDLAKPEEPVLLSELKLPGFSSYLHSFGDGLLLGIGEQDEEDEDDGDFYRHAKISVFSIKDNYNLKEICKKLIRDSETYAAENHKAVFVDEERKIIGLGVQYDNDYGFSHYDVYSYANKKLTKLLSQQSISSYSDLRGLRIGEYFYVVDPGREITVYDMPEEGQQNKMKKLN